MVLFQVPAKGAVAAVGNLQQGVETLQVQDYKDASMYYGAYPAYAYGGNDLLSSQCSVLEIIVKRCASILFILLVFL